MTNLKALLNAINNDLSLCPATETKSACELILLVQDMDSGERDTICAAFECGPLWDGDVPSKTSRDQLLSDGFISKVVVRGESGFNACTYKGADAYRLIKAGA